MRTFLSGAVLSIGAATLLCAQVDRVPAGTEVAVRTNETIDAKSPSDSRIYSGTVDRDVLDSSGRVVVPRGSEAELIMRDSSKNEVVLDLESVTVNGRRYAVSTADESVSGEGGKQGVGANKRTGKYVGGGAAIGSIIGAIAGGGKGAAIGAITGAGAGAVGQTVTRGGNVKIPAETVVTFRLDQPLGAGISDSGYSREGRHYHRYGTYDDQDSTRSRTEPVR